jgi:hypothetical protein
MQRSPRSAWLQWLLAGLASAIVMLSFVIPLVRSFMSRSTSSSERSRSGARSEGSPSIGFSIQRGDKILRGASGDVVLPGDRIRFTYSSERVAQFALLRASHDRAVVDFPRATTTVPLPAARDAALELEVELDKRAGAEHVFGLFCEAPLELEPVRAALQKDGDLPDVPGCSVDTVTLQKKLQ